MLAVLGASYSRNRDTSIFRPTAGDGEVERVDDTTAHMTPMAVRVVRRWGVFAKSYAIVPDH